MPGFQVNGERPFSFATSLIYVASSVVKHSNNFNKEYYKKPEHWDEAVGVSVGSSNIGFRSPDIVNS